MGLLRNMLRLSLVVVPTCALAGVAVEALAAVGGVRQGVQCCQVENQTKKSQN